jgi:hypothetical protein
MSTPLSNVMRRHRGTGNRSCEMDLLRIVLRCSSLLEAPPPPAQLRGSALRPAHLRTTAVVCGRAKRTRIASENIRQHHPFSRAHFCAPRPGQFPLEGRGERSAARRIELPRRLLEARRAPYVVGAHASRRSAAAFSTSGPRFRTRALPCASASSWQDLRSEVRAEPRGLRVHGRVAVSADAAPAPFPPNASGRRPSASEVGGV